MSGRSFHVKVSNSKSAIHQIKYGVPQGAVLSPSLYNVYTYDIPKLDDCQVSLFADDTAFYKSSRYFKEIEKTLQSAVNKFKSYFKQWKIQMNLNKTQAIFITNRRHNKFQWVNLGWATSMLIGQIRSST